MPKDLAARLERELRSGELSVQRSGTCSGYSWDVEWIAIGGNKPEMVADGSGLTGNSVTIGVTTKQNGGLLMAPIPGEFLRLPEKQPQVNLESIKFFKNTFNRSFITFTFAEEFRLSADPDKRPLKH